MPTLSTAQAAQQLGVRADQVKTALERGDLTAPLTPAVMTTLTGAPPRWLEVARKKRRSRKSKQMALAAARAERRPSPKSQPRALTAAAERITVSIPARQHAPASVVAHLGPTNSGKTHDAVEFLITRGQGVYAAPLRMLAQEWHRRLADRLGEEKVGLRTGEERINEHADILCCTVEMAPMQGDTLVLDEVHWAEERERGHAWTRLLAGGEYEHFRLLGGADALPLVRSAFPTAEVRIQERLGALDWEGAHELKELEPATVLVVFSRKAVLALASEAARQGYRVAALYGAMPVGARRAEIARFVSGDADICVATDVLGHGLNLPCRTVLFAETSKFDGVSRRPLLPWEIAQIAGRAGRYGMHESGRVGVLTGLPWSNTDPKLVEAALTPHVEISPGVYAYREVSHGRLRPRLEDLGVHRPDQLELALPLWARAARRRFAKEGWLAIEPIEPVLARLSLLKEEELLGALSTAEVWTLLNAPLDVDVDGGLLLLFAAALAGQRRARGRLASLLDRTALQSASLAEAEAIGRQAAGLRWFALTYPGYGVTIEQAALLETAAAERVAATLQREITGGRHGRCAACGHSSAPWFELCERCFERSRRQGW
jgi:ATP-dependent RNA helicase SUPV3L1/SUV3